MAALVGADLIHDVGLLGNATVVVPEMIVATDEIVAMVRHLLAEVAVDGEAMALDVIADVGPGGEYVTHDHTLTHFREIWYPELLFRSGDKAWLGGDQASFEERVNSRTRELMETHQPEPLPEETVAAVEAVVDRAEQREVS
jgi:trimethylamine--corrinoid protein Co-methyltransferase